MLLVFLKNLAHFLFSIGIENFFSSLAMTLILGVLVVSFLGSKVESSFLANRVTPVLLVNLDQNIGLETNQIIGDIGCFPGQI